MKIIFFIIIITTVSLTLHGQDGNKNDTTVYTYCSEMPEFPGGNTKLFHHLAKNISLPENAKDSGFTGSYCVRFIIEKDGAVTNAKIIKGGGKCCTCDKNILNVINSLPVFMPGKNNGKPVRVSMTLPIKLCFLR